MPDVIEIIGRSKIQHGHYNQRIYLMKPHPRETLTLLPKLDRLAYKNRYEKILAKVPSGVKVGYEKKGYHQEAFIPEYFSHRQHAVFMSKYLSPRRRRSRDNRQVQRILSLAYRRQQNSPVTPPENSLKIHSGRSENANEISQVFKTVFRTYPFPVFDAQYLSEMIRSNETRYFFIRKQRRIVAIGATEIDADNSAAEMTDFAILPEYRGQKYAVQLLEEMQRCMAAEGVKTAFGIARSLSPAMNVLFAGRGYSFGGTLGNNTNISGGIESMNVWFRRLEPAAYRHVPDKGEKKYTA